MRALVLGLLAAGLAQVGVSHAQRSVSAAPSLYPSKPIRFIVPFPPGGGTDTVGRMLAQRLTERLGQQVIVDNRGGANAIIGTEIAAKAPPDGYTLLFSLQANLAVNPSLYRALPYDPERDFSPVIQINTIALMLAAHPGLPAKNISELVRLAKSKPGQITYASSGIGGSSHLAMELLRKAARIELVHVPFKGGGPALTALLGGQVNLYSGPVLVSQPHVKAGRLKALGVTTPKRLASFPDVPAISETIPGYESIVWQGIVVPKRTPTAIVNRLNTEVNKILREPAIRDKFAASGADVVGGTQAAFAVFIKEETAKYAKLIKDAGIRAE
jgi:tripartite-type tricarboxylate transporter receptor subunit TctC